MVDSAGAHSGGTELEVIRAINEILDALLTSATEERLGEVCVEASLRLTESEFGFIGEVGNDGYLHDFAMSKMAWSACDVVDQSGHRRRPGDFELHGLYGEVVASGKTQIFNDPYSHPASVGTPAGHPRLESFIGVPLKDAGRTLGMIGLANRPGGYGDAQQEVLEAIAPAVTQAFLRTRAERVLRESEQRYQALVESTSDFIWEIDSEGRYTYCSPKMRELWGYDPSEMLGKTPFDLMPEEHRQDALDGLKEVARSSSPFQMETVSYNAAGDLVYIEVRGVPFYGDDGELLGFRGVTRDVTDRKRLSESEERLLALMNNNPSLVFLKDEEGRYVYMNPAYVEQFVGSDEWYGKTDFDFWGEESAELFRANDAFVLSSGETQQFIEDSKDKQGDRHVWLNYKFPFVDAQGRRYIGGIGVEATPMIEAQEALRESQSKTADLIRYAPTGIYELRLNPPKFLRINDAVGAITGYTRDELMAMNPMDLLDQPSQELFRSRIQAPAGGQLPDDTVEYTVLRKDGSEIFAVLNVTFGLDEQGRPETAFVIAHDVTERRRTEEALKQTSDALQAALADARQATEREERRKRRIEVLHEVLELGISALDVRTASQRILDYLSQQTDFDLGSIWLVNGEVLQLAGQVGYPPEFDRPVSLDEPADVPRSVKTGERVVVKRTDNPAIRSVYERMGIALGSYIVLPLRTRGQVTGVLALVWMSEQEFNEHDLQFYDSVADEVAVALENVSLYEQEHNVAETLQETLVVLPGHIPGIDFSRAYESATYQSGRVGGDFLDVFEIHPGLIGISLGDVSGKGVGAALTTSLVRTTLRVHAIDGLPPAKVAEKANAVFRKLTDLEAYVTLWFGMMSTHNGHVRYICAGHPPALVVSADSEIRELACKDPILGAFDDVKYLESQVMLAPRDRLFLYSDGATEARAPNDEFLDLAGLKELLLSHASEKTANLARSVMNEIVSFSEGVLRDDAAILVVEATDVRRM